MQLLTRDQLGWPATAAADQPTTQGVKVHYEGGNVPTTLAGDHSQCIQLWKDIRVAHMSDPVQGWVDIAYNYGCCQHGWVFEGRGLRKETGANGNQPLNHADYAVCGLLGSEGMTQPTDAMLGALRDAIELLQANGAGPEIKGHRDGYATDCPGEPLYAWVQAGAPRPGGQPTPSPTPQPPASSAPAWPGRYLQQGMSGDDVRQWQAQMSHRGWTIGVDGIFGPQTDRVVRQFQDEKQLGTDGIIGPKTWSAAWTAPIT
ncbi:peptidoglycan recognition protein family protein [Kitasatospora viridis]|uniref:Peptidoglycan hydrolase-like protein with peptidoglycan-binding domain n=1 Tax=Kitasatospora viridis TaxID=281105 RepID=A0A561S9X7_9ACTN|nr:N-acetylmuramoyl-L-alanine amidase [Kitasatospora viridis]TWF71676.1 peptidoglycan hydrolase-like protein with peptidoglycan-binding domain [Kitasatospora viridis]